MPRNPPETPEEWRARGRARYAKNREAIGVARRAARNADPALARKYHRDYYRAKVGPKYRFGLTIEQFKAKVAEAGGRCTICEADRKSVV